MAKDCFEDEHDDEDDQTEGWKDGRMEGCSQTQEESARIFLLVTEPNDSSDGTDVSAEVRPLPGQGRTKAEAVPPVKAKIGENTRDYRSIQVPAAESLPRRRGRLCCFFGKRIFERTVSHSCCLEIFS